MSRSCGQLLADITIILWMLFALVCAFTTDLMQGFFHFTHNAPVPTEGLAGILAQVEAHWPPAVVREWYWWWASPERDLLLSVNPLWYQAMAVVSPVLYAPFYVLAIYAFARGRKWIRLPGVCWAWGMLYSVVVILVEELFGEYRTPQPGLVLAAYGSYVVMPLLVLVRLWNRHPFAAAVDKSKSRRSTRTSKKSSSSSSSSSVGASVNDASGTPPPADGAMHDKHE